jgi:enoyl-CoA hydratase/carnithine racemase
MTSLPAERPQGLSTKVLFETVDEHIGVVTLNRPEKRNAIDPDMTVALGRIVQQTERDAAIRVILLRKRQLRHAYH